jgi:hypothetical protein
LKLRNLMWMVLLGATLHADGVRWSPRLKLMSRQEIDKRLAEPFGDIFQGSAQGQKVSVASCADYLQVSGKGFQPDGPHAAGILHNDAVECVALNMLKWARDPRAGFLPGFQMTVNTLSVLPPELAPAVSSETMEKEEAADALGGTWRSFAPPAQVRVVGPWRIVVTQPNWSTQVTLYARGDFSGGGQEELLMRADYHALGGTYGNSKLFLLASGTKPGRLRLVREIAVP